MKNLLDRGQAAELAKTGTVNVTTEKLYRERALELVPVERERAEGDDEPDEDAPLELEFAFASEEPVRRYFGDEELAVETGAARLDRVAQGVVPLLENHDSSRQIGRVLGVTIGEDRVARARVRFSRSAQAADIVQDVKDGIRQGVSFGYRVHRMELSETVEDVDRYRVTDWELYELTIASMPADPTIGVHRAADEAQFETVVSSKNRRTAIMVRALHKESGSVVMIDESQVDGVEFIRAADDPTPAQPTHTTPAPQVRAADINPTPSREKVLELERARVANVEEIGKQYSVTEDRVRSAVQGGTSVEGFLGELRLERSREGKALDVPATDLDMSTRERESFNIVDACNSYMKRKRGISNVANSLEMEASDEIANRLGRSAQGFFVPYDVLTRSAWGRTTDGTLETRVSTAYNGTAGTNSGAGLVGTDLMAANFIDVLRNRSVLGALGATIIPGLVGNVDFPKQLTDAAVGWVGEGLPTGDGVANTPSSSIEFGTVSMEPHTLRSRVDVTRRMLQQSTPAVEQILRNSIMQAIARGIDLAGLNGSGASNQPRGILNTTGIGSGTFSASTGATAWQSLLELETLVAAANADAGALAYVSTPEARGTLKGLFRDAGSGARIWEGTRDAPEVNGYAAEITNALPKNLGSGTNEHPVLAGYWPSLYIGEWGVLDLAPDEVTLGDSAGLVLRGFQDADVAVSHAAAFATGSFIPA